MSTELLEATSTELLEAAAESTVSTGWPASSAMESAWRAVVLWVIKPRSNAPQPGYFSIGCCAVEKI
jgi:hypothetical protein